MHLLDSPTASDLPHPTYFIRTLQELLGHSHVKTERDMYALLNRNRRAILFKFCTDIDEGGISDALAFSE
ncbi:MAG: hypothetical protein R3285_07065, partial [Kiloniellales bacterium]|nr:hypothetical protein [Kiloniellales bacterium]